MKVTYKESIVAFIDVLGFSNLVFNKDQSKIELYFTYILNDFNQYLSTRKFKYLLISDSIVIAATNTKESLSDLIFVLGKVQYQLLLKGILVRGALSFGNLYINKSNSIIVGPGLINAYRLETTAKYPRVIVDRRLISCFFESSADFSEYINQKFKKQYNEDEGNVKFSNRLNDGMPHVNYIRKLVRYGTTYHGKNSDNLLELLKQNYFSNEHFDKYNWLLEEMLEEFELGFEHYHKHPEFNNSKSRAKNMEKLYNQLSRL